MTRMHRQHVLITFAVALASFACAPQGRQGSGAAGPSGGQTEPAPAARPSRVAIGTWAEIPTLHTKLMNRPASGYHLDASYLVNSPLVVLDPKGAPVPRLATEIPLRERGSWTVNPDGTMAATWKIRPNAVWHDGQPVTSKDFAFALRVYKDPQVTVAVREPERIMDRLESIDEKTFAVHWSQTYPWANRLVANQLEALPEHILGPLYEAGDKDLFQNAGFWTSTSYIGSGPYRLVEWLKGSEMLYRAFDHYYLGRPKIDEVKVQVITDPSAVVGFVLGRAVDVTVNQTMNQKAWLGVKQQWESSGEGQIALIPVHLRATLIQLHPERTKLPALLDVRVRRALVHALDRAAVAEAVLEGASSEADLMMTPQDPLYPRAQQTIAKYPYDANRALALLQDAGWTRSASGGLVNATGERFAMEIRTTEMADNLTEMRIMADYFARIGMEILQTGVPEARNRDNEYRAEFPHLNITGQLIDLPKSLFYYSEGECPAAERRFIGVNRGCWVNADYDRLFQLAMTTLDEQERSNAILNAFRIVTEEAGVIPMSYNLDNIAVRKGLVGPGQRWPSAQGDTWNIHEWRWE